MGECFLCSVATLCGILENEGDVGKSDTGDIDDGYYRGRSPSFTGVEEMVYPTSH